MSNVRKARSPRGEERRGFIYQLAHQLPTQPLLRRGAGLRRALGFAGRASELRPLFSAGAVLGLDRGLVLSSRLQILGCFTCSHKGFLPPEARRAPGCVPFPMVLLEQAAGTEPTASPRPPAAAETRPSCLSDPQVKDEDKALAVKRPGKEDGAVSAAGHGDGGSVPGWGSPLAAVWWHLLRGSWAQRPPSWSWCRAACGVRVVLVVVGAGT